MDLTRWQLFNELGEGIHTSGAVARALERISSLWSVGECVRQGFIRATGDGYTVPFSGK